MRKVLLLAVLLFPTLSSAQLVLRPQQYGATATPYLPFIGTDGFALIGEVDGGTEVDLSCDGAAQATATNDFGVDTNTPGMYPLALTAAELQCASLFIEVSASVTQSFVIETYGHPSAAHPSLGLPDSAILHCEVNTLNFAGNTSSFACILTDLDGNAVTQASNDLTGLEVTVLDGAQVREKRFINGDDGGGNVTVWDGANSELRIYLGRAFPGTLADGVSVIIR